MSRVGHNNCDPSAGGTNAAIEAASHRSARRRRNGSNACFGVKRTSGGSATNLWHVAQQAQLFAAP
jgi:hypothetical protein